MWTDENGRFLSKISKDNVSWFKEEIHVEASFQGPTPYHPVRQNNINVHDYHYLSGRLSSLISSVFLIFFVRKRRQIVHKSLAFALFYVFYLSFQRRYCVCGSHVA